MGPQGAGRLGVGVGMVPFHIMLGQCVGTSENNYFSKISKMKVKMKGNPRETDFHPGKVGGVGPCLSLCETAESMVLVWRGTQALLVGKVTKMGNKGTFIIQYLEYQPQIRFGLFLFY